jgi:hypothetical protein
MCGDGDFYAWASPENSAVYLTPATMSLLPIMRLEVLVHEITHTLQYALDFSPDDLLGFRTRNRFNSDGFHAFARTLGWNAVPILRSKLPAIQLAVKVCESDYPFRLTYLGREGKAWQDDWATFVNEGGSIPTALNPQLKAKHMVSWAGFSDAWEWNAEYAAAFVLNKLFDAANRLCTHSQVEALRQRLHRDMDIEQWNYVNENAVGLPSYENVIVPQFHVADDSWNALAQRFLLGSYPRVCSQR